MITGHGLVAKAFRGFATNDRVHVFASGVSRSLEDNDAAFRRESDLILAQRLAPGRFVYFSSCGVFDPSLEGSKYIRHKLATEQLVRELYPDHLIIRLPNLVGHTDNPHTLTNFLRDRIVQNGSFELHSRACRYLLDMDDAVQDLSPMLLRPDLRGTTMNVSGSVPVTLPELVRSMEHVLGKRVRAITTDKGSCYTIDNGLFLSLLPASRREAYARSYTMELLLKYYGPARSGPEAMGRDL